MRIIAEGLLNLVSGYEMIPSSTWATRGAGAFVGQIKRITDVGVTPAGSLFIWTGTTWWVLFPTTLYVNVTDVTAALNTNEQILVPEPAAARPATALGKLALVIDVSEASLRAELSGAAQTVRAGG